MRCVREVCFCSEWEKFLVIEKWNEVNISYKFYVCIDIYRLLGWKKKYLYFNNVIFGFNLLVFFFVMVLVNEIMILLVIY